MERPKDVFELINALKFEGEMTLARGRGGEYRYSFPTDMNADELKDMLRKLPEISLDNGSARVKLIGYEKRTQEAVIAVYDKTREHKRPIIGVGSVKPKDNKINVELP